MSVSGWSKITKAGNSLAQWFTQQITYNKKVSKAVIYNPYGFHANAQSNDSVAFWVGVNGDASNKIGFAWNPNTRPDLKEGEVSMYQPTKNTFITFLQDGTIEINTDVAINVTSPDVTVNSTTSVTVVSPTITLDGDATVTGNLQVDGVATLGSGGALIARLGDTTTVTIPGGSSAGTYAGSITSGSPGGHTAS